MKLSVEEKLLLSVVKLQPTVRELEYIDALIPLITDWNNLADTLIARCSGPLLYIKLPLLSNATQIPSVIKSKLQQAYYKTLSRSMVLYDTFSKVVRAFTKAGLEQPIALKGIYLSEWLYEDIALRQFSDIDLLVRHEDGEKYLEVLNSMGFKPRKNIAASSFIEAKSDFAHYPPMELNDISIEIHIKLHYNSEKYKLSLDKIWENAISVVVNGVQVKSLQVYDLIIHLCVHLDKHLKHGHLQFTSFNDVVNLLSKYADTLDWHEFIERCKLYNSELPVFNYLILINKYYHVVLPFYIIENYKNQLSENDEELFFKYLHGNEFKNESKTIVVRHWHSLKHLTTKSDFVKYLVDVLFPPKTFMLYKYSIKHAHWYWLWYPYRWGIGLKGFIQLTLSAH